MRTLCPRPGRVQGSLDLGACGQWALWTQDFGRGGWGPRLCLGLLSPWGRAPGAVLPRRTLPLSRHPNYRINKSTLWDLEYTRSGQKMMKTSARAHARQRHALLQPARFPRVSSLSTRLRSPLLPSEALVKALLLRAGAPLPPGRCAGAQGARAIRGLRPRRWGPSRTWCLELRR